MDLPDRVVAKIDAAGPMATHHPELGRCWLWTAAQNGNGYGVVRVDGRLWLAHRWIWEQANGAVPDGLELDHFACDRRDCVNPDHARAVTHAANLRRSDSPSGVHGRKDRCVHGHPFDAANTRLYRGKRVCVACRDRRNAARAR